MIFKDLVKFALLYLFDDISLFTTVSKDWFQVKICDDTLLFFLSCQILFQIVIIAGRFRIMFINVHSISLCINKIIVFRHCFCFEIHCCLLFFERAFFFLHTLLKAFLWYWNYCDIKGGYFLNSNVNLGWVESRNRKFSNQTSRQRFGLIRLRWTWIFPFHVVIHLKQKSWR